MAKVIAGITTSLDGYVTGPNDRPGAGLGDGGWGDDSGFGVPVFVVTHRPDDTVVKGDTTFEFVTGGIADALARARAAAAGKNVIVVGGADLLRRYLAAGLVDELTLTIAPVLLGAGKRLFDGISRTDVTFERTGVIESPFATHLRFRVHLGPR